VAVLLSAPLLVASLDYVTEASLGGHSVWGHVGGFLTTSLLLLALFGLFSRGRRGLRFMLLGWIVLTLARIYGEPRLLSDVVGMLPGMSRVAFYRYGMPALELAVIVLAALGLDEIARGRISPRRLAGITTIVLGAVAVAVVGARPLAGELSSGFGDHPYVPASAAWGAATVLAVAGAALLRDSRARAALASLVVAVDALVLFALPQASAPRDVSVDLAPVRFLQRHLGTSRFFTLGPLQPNYGSYFGIASLNVNDVPVPSAFASYVTRRLDSAVDPTVLVGNEGGGRPVDAPSSVAELHRNLTGYRAAGVAYVLTPADEPLPESRTTLRLVFRSPSTRIYRLAGAAAYFTASSPTCTVRAEGRGSVRVSCPNRALLVRRETALSGWSASIDGQKARVRRIDGLFQGVAVGAGTHRVTFDYSPPHVGWALGAFAAGCAWLLLGVFGSRRRVRQGAE
jgi:hypothetical protein